MLTKMIQTVELDGFGGCDDTVNEWLMSGATRTTHDSTCAATRWP
jgi:hypothetical protein